MGYVGSSRILTPDMFVAAEAGFKLAVNKQHNVIELVTVYQGCHPSHFTGTFRVLTPVPRPIVILAGMPVIPFLVLPILGAVQTIQPGMKMCSILHFHRS